MLCQKARATGIPLIRGVFTEAPWLSCIIGTGEPTLMLIKCAQIL